VAQFVRLALLEMVDVEGGGSRGASCGSLSCPRAGFRQRLRAWASGAAPFPRWRPAGAGRTTGRPHLAAVETLGDAELGRRI
jgi:hypothetical protein